MPLPECKRIDIASNPADLLADGWREIEILETWEGRAARIRGHEWEDLAECERIARASFTYDRLHTDELVAVQEADDARAEWVRRAFFDNEKTILVAAGPIGSQGTYSLNGFMIYSTIRHTLVIDMIAVDSGSRGRGIAKLLIGAGLFKSGCQRVRAGTQEINDPAKALYRGLGMEIKKRQRTFHR